MEWINLKGEVRKAKGTIQCEALRRKGAVPAVLYGRKEEQELLTVQEEEFNSALAKGVRLLNLVLPDRTEKVLIKEVQIDHLKEKPIHIDFHRVALDETLTTEVEIILKGQPKGVVADGGILDQNLHKITIKCLPTNIPPSITVDVSALEIGGLVRVKDLSLPAGVTAVTDAEIAVAGVHMRKVEEVAPVTAEAGAAEPEVITAKKETEEGAEGEAKEEKKGAKEEKKPAAGAKEEKKPRKEEK